MENHSTIELIEKEQVSNYSFPADDVLTDKDQIKIRLASLEKAALLGNGYKGKVKIIFQTTEGLKAVETTVWQASEDNILLKGSTRIPIHAVVEVQI